jgi:hypothetical protein
MQPDCFDVQQQTNGDAQGQGAQPQPVQALQVQMDGRDPQSQSNALLDCNACLAWIASLHPENITIDHRMRIPGNNWLEVLISIA